MARPTTPPPTRQALRADAPQRPAEPTTDAAEVAGGAEADDRGQRAASPAGATEPAFLAGAPRRSHPLVGAASSARLAWAVAVLASAAAVLLASWWAPLHNAARDREQVRAAGQTLALQLTTFEGEHIDQWVADMSLVSTGDYAEQVDALFDQALRDQLRALQAVSRGELLALFVQDVDGDDATVFAVVRQTIVNSASEGPVEDELRMEISMRRVDGQWKASDVAVLGPSGIVVGQPAGGAGGG